MNSILFVDDEKAILRSLSRLLYRTGWKLYFAEDGIEALNVLAESKIDLLISDMRMPNMDGHKLLREVQRLYPDTIRLILSGYSEEKEVYMAVLDGAAKSYLLKPWEPDRLLPFLQSIFEMKELLKDRGLYDTVENTKSIPTFRCTVEEINRLIDEDGSTAQIAAIIEKDPGITAKLLQLVNSSSYDKSISSVKQAVYQMGNSVIKHIINDSNYTRVADLNTEIGVRYKLMKQHAVLTNRIMELTFREYLNKEITDIAITASTLHNIGMVLVESDDSLVSHDEIGGYLLKWWGIPEQIVECAFFHHKPIEASEENQILIWMLHLANYYANSFLDLREIQLDEKVFEMLEIDKSNYEQFINSIIDSFSELTECYCK